MTDPRKTIELVALVIPLASITAFTVLGFMAKDWMPSVASEHGAGVTA